MKVDSTRTRIIYAVCLAVVLLVAFVLMFITAKRMGAQTLNLDQPTGKPAGHVQFAAETQSVAANKAAVVVLHFHVDPGFHINSHTPKSEMLIATKIAVEDAPTAQVTAVDFPPGQPFSFSFSPKEKLDVYTGDLTLAAHLQASPGPHELRGALRYQACDAAACYPPKMLPVKQPFTAK